LYAKGAKAKIDLLNITDLELAAGGRLRLTLEDIPRASVKLLSELLEVLAGVAKAGSKTEAVLEIGQPDDACAFVKELRKKRDVGLRSKSSGRCDGAAGRPWLAIICCSSTKKSSSAMQPHSGSARKPWTQS